MALLTPTDAELAAVVESWSPRPERTALRRLQADTDLARAALDAIQRGDIESARELMEQPQGSRPRRVGDSFPPRG